MSDTAAELFVTKIEIKASGAKLVGRLYEPSGAPRAAVVLHAATGVPQSYYAKFASWLATTEQVTVMTYDYRDFGESAVCSVRLSGASMVDWGVKDQSAALDALCERFPSLPIWVVGHSLGGMYLPFHTGADRVARVIAVAAGPAYWAKHPLSYMPQVILFWFLLGPIATWILGYLPGKRLGLGADLPAQVYWQWRRWCLSPAFNRADWGKALPNPDLKSVKADVTLVGIGDDVMIPPYFVRALANYYPAARIDYREIAPKDIGSSAIGHLRLFTERCRAAWPVIMKPMAEA
ncbi:MAG: alpha/beta fold hydrolase [Alphaproteobacteria bacterium]